MDRCSKQLDRHFWALEVSPFGVLNMQYQSLWLADILGEPTLGSKIDKDLTVDVAIVGADLLAYGQRSVF